MSTLDSNKYNYIFNHLFQHIDSKQQLLDKFEVVPYGSTVECKNKIVFQLYSDWKEIRHTSIDDLLIFHPNSSEQRFYYFDDSNNLIFEHDLLSSAFYLLSGYQETISNKTDQLGRYSYDESLQARYQFVDKPLVNYYFDKIVEGILAYANKQNSTVSKKRLFTQFGFLLSHDIDVVDKYDYNNVGYKIKQLLGLTKEKVKLKTVFKYLVNFIFPSSSNNPYWNFDYLMDVSEKMGHRSSFYFLPKGEKHVDSYYEFNDARIKNAMQRLGEKGFEVGLHGTVKSHVDEREMSRIYKDLQKVCAQPLIGTRQHRLMFDTNKTFSNQQKVGLKYDTTLGFAAHEGFRNSYCYPFQPFDFTNNQPYDLYEFPLVAMDVTLFNYRGLTQEKAKQNVIKLCDEVIKFGGIFSLLWHNNFFDTERYPNIYEYYEQLLLSINAKKCEGLSGAMLYNKLQKEQ